jgi:hypothetical protein
VLADDAAFAEDVAAGLRVLEREGVHGAIEMYLTMTTTRTTTL